MKIDKQTQHAIVIVFWIAVLAAALVYKTIFFMVTSILLCILVGLAIVIIGGLTVMIISLTIDSVTDLWNYLKNKQ